MNILRKLFLTLIFSAGLNAEWDFPNEEILNSGPAQKFLHVGIDASGNAITVWDNDTSAQVLASNWNGTAWLPVAPHTILATSSDQSNLAVSANGTALAVWRDAGSPFEVNAAFWNGSSWMNNGSISDKSSDEPLVVMNASGIGFAIWTENTLGADIKTNRWNGSSWTGVQNVTAGFNTSDHSIGIDASGNAVAIWEDMNEQIFSSTWIDFFMPLKDSNGLGFAPTSDFIATIFGDDFFPSTIPLAPSDFAGRVEKNKFLTQTEHINFLTWTPSPDTSVVGYRVYEGESTVAEVSSEGPFEATIHSRIKNFPYTYRLVTFNAGGQESDPLILNVN